MPYTTLNNIIMEKIEKGSIIEIKVPNVEKPIKAIVLDTIENSCSDYSSCYVYILYAQKRIFKAFNWCHWGMTENPETGEQEEYTDWSDFQYDGIIVDYCDIPIIPSDI